MTNVVFDCELIGSTKPVFLVCIKINRANGSPAQKENENVATD